MEHEDKKARQRAATARYRERLKARGMNPHARSNAQRKAATKRLAAARAAAQERGEKLPTDTWWSRNPDKHRARVTKWRADNEGRAREVGRQLQSVRRSTPWGKINNCMWPLLHSGVRSKSSRWGRYNKALGYRWIDLREHLEERFDPGMSWDNWGDVWELDHITPLSLFKFESIDDPRFREAWQLSNLRPLCRLANGTKGNRIPNHRGT